jgi:hypothetical protein
VSAWDHVYLGLFWMYNCISSGFGFLSTWRASEWIFGHIGLGYPQRVIHQAMVSWRSAPTS